MQSSNIKTSETTKFVYKIFKILYTTATPNYWFGNIETFGNLNKIRDILSHFIDLLLGAFLVFEWGAFITQRDLTEKQAGDRMLMSVAHLFQYSFVYCFKYHREHISEVLYKLVTELKVVHNDLEVEREMITKAKMYLYLQGVMAVMTVTLYAVNGIVQCWFADGTFTTVIPMWPDVNDRSQIAGVARVVFYLLWCLFVTRSTTTSTLLVTLTTCLSHQYKNLACYFYSLNGIFEGAGTQQEKEQTFEEAFKVGIKCHISTLWCTQRCQRICSLIFGGQILLNVIVLSVLMIQMADPSRTASTAATVAGTSAALLLTTGFVMWSAGDLTVEATFLPSAMFHSGWQYCGTDLRARKLLAVAMMRAQEPVEMVCLGTVTLSYASYVSIVKSSYSVFSVLY